MNRRRFLVASLAGGLTPPRAVGAQQAARSARVGVLGVGTPSTAAHLLDALRRGLRDLGYIEGQSVVFEVRLAERPELLRDRAADLARMDVDVIVAAGTPAVLAARAVTQKTPIVMVAVSDPVGGGLVASLARPGGRLTGIAAFGPELGAKRLEVLKEIVPKVQKIAVLLNQANPAVPPIWDETRLAAAALDLLVEPVDVQAPEALERAFANVLGKRPSALLLLPDPTVFTHQRQIAEFALRNHLPAMSAFREFPAAGGLLSYGPSIPAIAERGAIYVAKILKGAKPADLPVEQPTRFELVINLKTPRPPASRSRRRCWRGRTR